MLRGTGTAGRRRSGFTLPEILVVMLIIAVLAALLIPAVFKAQDSAKRAETTFATTQIGMAADTFCTSEQLGRVGYLPAPPFRLRGNYTAPATPSYDYELNYLRNVFGANFNSASTGLPDAQLDGNQVAMFFLTGGTVTNYSGFSTNPQTPFALPSATAVGEKRKGPLLQLKDTQYMLAPNGQAWLTDAYRQPLAIFTCGQFKNYRDSQTTTSLQSFTYGGVTVNPYYRGSATSPTFQNPKSIQVISAGRDKTFGAGGSWDGMIDNPAAMDDASNFSTAGLGYGPP